jgi:hypothetical protein
MGRLAHLGLLPLLPPFGLSEPFGLRQGSRTALSKGLTSVGSAAAALPPFGLIELFGIRQGSRSAPAPQSLSTASAPCFGRMAEETKEIEQQLQLFFLSRNCSENRTGKNCV